MEGDGERKERPRSGAEGIRAARAPPAEPANTPPTPLRRKDAQVQVRRSATKSKGGGGGGRNVQKCGYSARAAAKIYVTARVPSRFTPGHHEPRRAS